MMLGTNKGSKETGKRIPKNSIGVELGVWRGDSSEIFLQRAKHIYLVDTWSLEPYQKDSNEHGNYDEYVNKYFKIVKSRNPKDFQKYYDDVYMSVVKRFAGKPVTIHRCTTDEFFNNFVEKVDWVYVDALHSFEGCLSDLRNSLKILKPNGIIFGDDYGNKPGVVKALDTFVRETNLVLNNFYKTQYEVKLNASI